MDSFLPGTSPREPAYTVVANCTMVGVKVIGTDPDFQPELAAAGSRLAVVKFTMAG